MKYSYLKNSSSRDEREADTNDAAPRNGRATDNRPHPVGLRARGGQPLAVSVQVLRVVQIAPARTTDDGK